MCFLRFAVSLSILTLFVPRGCAQEPAKTSVPGSIFSNEEQTGDPDNKRVHVSRFVIAPGQELNLPVLTNESLVICLRGESLSQIPIRGPEERWACGPGSTISNRGGATHLVANTGEIPAEILVVDLKDSYAIAQLRVPWSERDPVNQDPSHFRMLFENAHARVLLVHLNSREGAMESQFADRLEIALTALHASVSDVDGKNYEVRRDAGTVRWEKAVMYSAVNLDEQPLEKLIIELKHPFCYEVHDSMEEIPGAPSSVKAYLAKVREAIDKKWLKHMPSGVRGGDDRGMVILQFKIDADGTLPEGGLIFRKVFADDLLMEKALSAVRDASPFPPLPPEVQKPFIQMRLQFMYNLPRQPPGCR